MDKMNVLQTSSFEAEDITNLSSYFTNCMNLLQDFSFIYNIQLTNFFTEKAWQRIPHEWKECLILATTEQLNKIPFGHVEEAWPLSLRTFLQSCLQLSISRTLSDVTPVDLRGELRRGMNPKKQHEVAHISSLIHDLCKDLGFQNIIDVGAGLGYLGVVLSHELNYKVLGIECDPQKSQTAAERATKISKRINQEVHYQSIPLWIEDTEESLANFHKTLRQHFCGNGDNMSPKDVSENLSADLAVSEINRCDQRTMTCEFSHSETSHISQATCVSDETDSVAPESQALGNRSISSRTTDLYHPGVNHENSQSSHRSGSLRTNNFQSSSSKDQGHENTPSEHNNGVVLVGLHSCGDLTPTMLRLYSQVEELRLLVAFSCCYHKMSHDGEFLYKHFPMSQCLNNTMKQEQFSGWGLNTFALRLAAQETRSRWQSQSEEEHHYHQNSVAFRGVLQLAIQNENLTMSKTKRALAKQEDFTDFPAYIDTVLPRISLQGTNVNTESLKQRMIELYACHKEGISCIQPFTCLQVTLQGVLETLVLMDRVAYVLEQGYFAKLIPAMDENISPRNMALVSWKS